MDDLFVVLNDPFPDFRVTELIRCAESSRLKTLRVRYTNKRGLVYSLVLFCETGQGSSFIQYEIFFDPSYDSWVCREVRRF